MLVLLAAVVTGAKAKLTLVQQIGFSNCAANTIPEGWTLINDIDDDNPEGETRPSGSSQGSGPRLFHFETGDYQDVFYVRSTKSADKHGKTVATYGDIEGNSASLPKGMLRILFLASGYKAAGQKILCEVIDATEKTVLASLEATTTVVTPNGGPAALERFTIKYDNAEERNAILRYTVFGDGTKETILSAINIYYYDESDINLTANAGDAADEYWATYYDSSEGYRADANTTVYQAAVNGTKTGVVLTEVTGREIPAGKAVVLKSSASSITLTPAETTQTLTGNELKGSDVDLSTPSNAYCLSKETTGTSPRGIGFYTYTLTTIPANKAYLVVEGGSATSRGFLGFGEDDNTTAIEAHKAISAEADGTIYDLSGRRVTAQPQKGFYVKNGKKFVIK